MYHASLNLSTELKEQKHEAYSITLSDVSLSADNLAGAITRALAVREQVGDQTPVTAVELVVIEPLDTDVRTAILNTLFLTVCMTVNQADSCRVVVTN